MKNTAEPCAVEMSGGRFGGCHQSKFFCVLLGAVEAVAGQRASSRFVLVGGGSGARARRKMLSRIGHSLDERADLCVRRDGDGAWGGEEEARIRQDAPSIAEKEDRATVLGSDADGPSP